MTRPSLHLDVLTQTHVPGDCYKEGLWKKHAEETKLWYGKHKMLEDEVDDPLDPVGIIGLVRERENPYVERMVTHYLGSAPARAHAVKNELALEQAFEMRVSRLFRELDRDQSGLVSLRELRAAVHMLERGSPARAAAKDVLEKMAAAALNDRVARGLGKTDNLRKLIISHASFVASVKMARSGDNAIDEAVNQMLLIFGAKEKFTIEWSLIVLAILPFVAAVLCVSFMLLQGDYSTDYSVEKSEWLNATASAIAAAVGPNSTAYTGPHVHVTYGGFYELTFLTVIAAVLHTLPWLVLAVVSARPARLYFGLSRVHPTPALRWGVGIAFIVVGFLSIGALVVLPLLDPAGSVTNNRVLLNSAVLIYSIWAGVFVFQLVLASVRLEAESIVSTYREYRLMAELPIHLPYTAANLNSGYDLLNVIRRLRKARMEEHDERTTMRRIDVFIAFFSILLSVLYVTSPYFINYGGADTPHRFFWAPNDLLVAIGLSLCMLVSVVSFQLDASILSSSYRRVQMDLTLIGELMSTSGDSPYLMLNNGDNLVAWHRLRQFLAHGALDAEQFSRNQVGFAVVSFFFALALITYVVSVIESNVAFFFVSVTLLVLLAAYQYDSMSAASNIYVRRREHLKRLIEHRFILSASTTKIEDDDARAEAEGHIRDLSNLITVVEKTDTHLKLFGITLSPQTLASFRASMATVVVGGFQALDFRFLSEAIKLIP